MRAFRGFSVALLVACLAPALAWSAPISEVLATAKSGDIVSIEGRVVNTTTGSGSLLIAILTDDSGEVPVAVPESLTRKLDMRQGEATGGQRYRVVGRWDHKHMDEGTWGIYAQQIDRIATP